MKETEGRRATPSPGLLAAGGQNAKVPAVRAAGGALPGRRHASPRQRRRDSRTVNCQHNRESAEPKDAAQDAAERWEKRGRLLSFIIDKFRVLLRFSVLGSLKETEGRRATPSPGLLAAGGQNAKVPAVRAAGGALPGRRHASPRQRRRDSRTVNCQHNRGKAPSPRTLRRTPLSVGNNETQLSRVRAGRRGLHCGG